MGGCHTYIYICGYSIVKRCLRLHHTLSGGGGGHGCVCLRSFPKANRLLPQVGPASFRVGGGLGGIFAFVSQANGKHTRSRAPAPHCIHASQMVSTPAQVHPLSTVSMPGNGKHASSRAPCQHCIHASQMVSTPAPVSIPANGKQPRSSAPSHHCIHAW